MSGARRLRSMLYLATAVVFVLYAALLFQNNSHVAGGPDESGYMNAARLFASGVVRVEVEPLRRWSLDSSWLHVFTPLGFAPSGDRWMVPTYPPGLPVHLIIGGFFVSPILALGCLVLTFLLAREMTLPLSYALAAGAVLAVTPQFIMFALQVMSDVPATFWALLSVWLALRATDRAAIAVAAGIAFGIGLAVRPTHLLVAIPIVFAVRFDRRRLLAIGAGAAPCVLALLWYQHVVYGGALTTGYGGISILGLSGFAEKLWFYSFWMGRTLSPLVAPAGLLVVFNRRISRWHRALLASWYVVFLGFYCLWHLFPDWWYTRFLLPATPALIIAALLVIRDLPFPRVLKPALILVLIAVPWLYGSKQRVLRIDDHQQIYIGAMRWSAPLLPADALVVSGVLSGSFFLYQDRLTARWDQLDADRFAVLRARAGTSYAVISDVEADMAEFRRRLPGAWKPISRFENVTMYRLD